MSTITNFFQPTWRKLTLVLLLTLLTYIGLSQTILKKEIPGTSKKSEAGVSSPQRFVNLFQQGNDIQSTSRRNDIFVLNEWNSSRIQTIKAANPSAKILLYKNSAYLRDDDNTSTVTGFSTGENINVNHPDWFLRKTDGSRIFIDYYSNGIKWYFMDWGNQSWRDYWTRMSIDKAKALGFDGIFADDLYTHQWGVLKGVSLLGYSADTGLQTAARGFLANAYGDTRPDNLLIIPNIVDHLWYDSLWADWLTISDGIMDEHFIHDGTDPNINFKSLEDWWKKQADEVVECERQGKDCLFITHTGDNPPQPGTANYEVMIYGYGSYMLGAGGRSKFFCETGGSYNNVNWFSVYDLDLGAPLGSYKVSSNNVYYRDFNYGKVVVNPSKANTLTFTLGQGYTNEFGNQLAETITLKPRQAIIAKKASVTTTTSTTTLSTTTTTPTTTSTTTTTTTLPPTTTLSSTTTSLSTTTTTLSTTTTTIPVTTTTLPTNYLSVSFLYPANGSTVSGKTSFKVYADTNLNISKIDLYIDGTLYSTDKKYPYYFNISTSSWSAGAHIIKATATATNGTSATGQITVYK